MARSDRQSAHRICPAPLPSPRALRARSCATADRADAEDRRARLHNTRAEPAGPTGDRDGGRDGGPAVLAVSTRARLRHLAAAGTRPDAPASPDGAADPTSGYPASESALQRMPAAAGRVHCPPGGAPLPPSPDGPRPVPPPARPPARPRWRHSLRLGSARSASTNPRRRSLTSSGRSRLRPWPARSTISARTPGISAVTRAST